MYMKGFMKRSWYIIANWKMYLSYQEAITWCKDNRQKLAALSNHVSLGIAPEVSTLSSIASLFASYSITIGGQTCSSHAGGAYTGQLHPQSLQDIGCDFCIIGHSEQRAYYGVTSQDVARKTEQLGVRNITPVICVGETQAERDQERTDDVLWQQVHIVLKHVAHMHIPHLYIAYEPRWAIGAGVTPSTQEIADAAHAIRSCAQTTHHPDTVSVLYGGSVSPDNSRELSCIEPIDGFLVGSASCDFQKLQNIVYSIER